MKKDKGSNRVTYSMYENIKDNIIKYRDTDFKDKDLKFKISNETNNLISKTGLNLLDDFPFLFGIFYRTDRKIDYNGDACMSVSIADYKITLNINPLMLVKVCRDDLEVYGVLLHEVLHLLYKHLIRYNSEFDLGNDILINIATDCQINQEIKNLERQSKKSIGEKRSFKLPKSSVSIEYVRRITKNPNISRDKSSRYYYEELLKCKKSKEDLKEDKEKLLKNIPRNYGSSNKEDNNNNNNNKLDADNLPVNDGVDILNQSGLDKESTMSVSMAKKVIDNVIKSSYESLSSKSRGLLTKNFKDELNLIYKEPALDWKKEVRISIGNITLKSVHTRKRLNRRQPNRIDLSGKKYEKIGTILVFIDVSASMCDESISYILGEILNIVNSFGNRVQVRVIQIDREIKSNELVKREADINLINRNGKGGTRFQPAYDYLKENKFTNRNSYSIYFTDGMGEPSVDEFRYKMRWVLTNRDCKGKISAFPELKVPYLWNDEKLQRLNF